MNKIKILGLALSFVFLGAACTPGGAGVKQDGGAWLSFNRGERWEQKGLIFADRMSQKTIGDLDVSRLVFSPNDSRKIFALSYQGGLWISWNAGNNWNLIISASGVNDIAVNPANPRTFYVAVGSSIAKTENDGDVFKAIYTNDQKLNEVTSLALAPDNPNILYAGTRAGQILLSENAGASWREVSQLNAVVEKLAIHPNNPGIMYIGVSGKGLGQSTDKGKNWKFYSESGSFSSFSGASEFRDFTLIPTGIVYASRFGLLRSLNQGKDWVNLPLISDKNDSNIYSLAVNPKNPLEIYYGTRSTFYRSVDGGFNWIPRQLPSTRAALSILVNPDNQDIVYLGVGRVR